MHCDIETKTPPVKVEWCGYLENHAHLKDLDSSNNKKTSGKSVSVYKARANRVVSFEIPKDILTRYAKPFVNIFNQYNDICDKFNITFKFDFIGRQTFREDGKYRHINEYQLFSGWRKNKEPLSHLQNYRPENAVSYT